MITPLIYNVPLALLDKAAKETNLENFRSSVNKPTGNFFYDPWTIREEFKGTVWEEILNTLPLEYGEARIIVLNPASCYQLHADIDDRYHLNIQSEAAFLFDLENNHTYPVKKDGIWYEMDAGRLHSAANMGRLYRIQLVVRRLLTRNVLKSPLTVKISSNLPEGDSRYIFDQSASRWLNKANKESKISNFIFDNGVVKFDIEQSCLEEFESILDEDFIIEII